ncbi:hypothetical protein BDW42DRAFT_75143 [Aspergillus taichungensis]|uniref:Uncharacterized protein n=1 Tax=Aspergillus taichungensis TaxID=482145 RepID=A0A2J5HZL4_9EURO|nr:hypothetical protein BDW42DRAFT_75143 [Aspergillus taichungensis]
MSPLDRGSRIARVCFMLQVAPADWGSIVVRLTPDVGRDRTSDMGAGGSSSNTQLRRRRALIRLPYLDILPRAAILLPRVITLPPRAVILPLRCNTSSNRPRRRRTVDALVPGKRILFSFSFLSPRGDLVSPSLLFVALSLTPMFLVWLRSAVASSVRRPANAALTASSAVRCAERNILPSMSERTTSMKC